MGSISTIYEILMTYTSSFEASCHCCWMNYWIPAVLQFIPSMQLFYMFRNMSAQMQQLGPPHMFYLICFLFYFRGVIKNFYGKKDRPSFQIPGKRNSTSMTDATSFVFTLLLVHAVLTCLFNSILSVPFLWRQRFV